MTRRWDREVDLLVAGTGAAGLSAAITAKDAGAEVLVVESTELWGGTTTMSGGGLWMPAHPLMAGLGKTDTAAKALLYLDTVIGDVGPASSPERRRAFVHAVPGLYTLLERLGVRWAVAADYPDYYPDKPGGMTGRSIEVEPFDVRKLGDWFAKSRARDGLPPVPLKTDDVWLIARSWSTRDGFARGARFAGRTAAALLTGKRLYGTGTAVSASLMHIVRTQGTEVLLESPVTELVIENGEVTGAIAGGLAVRARQGVLLGAGGFAHNTEWREKHHGLSGWSSASTGDQGTAIELGLRAGAQLALMDDAWWGAGVPMPDGTTQFLLWERSFPYSIVVDGAGDRYLNESESYVDFGHHMLEHNAVPSWLIVDGRHRRRYLFAALAAGGRKLRETGTLVQAETIERLATKLRMDPWRLRATVERFNRFAASGLDEDFGRGRTAYDRYYGDPTVEPNPNLGALEKPPFQAIKLVPGDLGTKGGLLTDEHARVLDTEGTPIPGLYAAGNTTASVMGRTYPGAGATIAPAAIFGYLGALHATGRRSDGQ
jgi:3-oxosteroid 1-dehydrogenase